MCYQSTKTDWLFSGREKREGGGSGGDLVQGGNEVLVRVLRPWAGCVVCRARVLCCHHTGLAGAGSVEVGVGPEQSALSIHPAVLHTGADRHLRHHRHHRHVATVTAGEARRAHTPRQGNVHELQCQFKCSFPRLKLKNKTVARYVDNFVKQ